MTVDKQGNVKTTKGGSEATMDIGSRDGQDLSSAAHTAKLKIDENNMVTIDYETNHKLNEVTIQPNGEVHFIAKDNGKIVNDKRTVLDQPTAALLSQAAKTLLKSGTVSEEQMNAATGIVNAIGLNVVLATDQNVNELPSIHQAVSALVKASRSR